jgi:hypothetical protein
LFAVLGVPVCLYQLYLALRHQPYLVINEEGIRLNAPPMNGDIIPWSEIEALSVLRRGNRDGILYLVPRTPTTIPSGQDLGQWLFSMKPPGRATGDIRLTGFFPSIPPKELVHQIMQRYSHEVQTYHVAV